MSVVHPYRIKHKATGLYYTPRACSNLNEKGKVYFSANNLINYLGAGWGIDLHIFNKKLIEKHRDALEKCGEISSNGGSWYKYGVASDEFEKEDFSINDIE